MTPNKAGVLAAAVLGCVLVVGSVAWACVMAEAPYVEEPAVQGVPVGEQVPLHGGNWVASTPVEIDWRSTSVQVAEPLGAAIVDSTGVFSARVRVPDVPAGFYYISVSQESVTVATSVEVVGAQRAVEQTPPVSGVEQSTGQLWNGLPEGSPNPSLPGVVADSERSPLHVGLIVAATAAAGISALGVFMFTRTRRAVTNAKD